MGAIRVLVVFGGRSGEHEVSVVSARAVLEALDALGHAAVPVGISRGGAWVRCDPRKIERVPEDGDVVVVAPGSPVEADVAFPVLHGPYGEDGCVQGLFELVDLPYVGAAVEGSAVGMNKVVHKTLFRSAGLPVVDFVDFARSEWTADPGGVRERVAGLGFPCFAKPSRLGSSVGISKVHTPDELDAAVHRALENDDLVIVEASGGPRELEVGVLEEEDGLRISVVGEVTPDGEWYDYRAKYRGEWTQLTIPADVPDPVSDRVHEYAATAFRAAGCEGFARVDFFWDPSSERLLVNEINTIPGLTPASMFPKVWEASGVPFRDVVQRLLDHALARHRRKRALEAARAASHDREVGRV